MAANLILAAIFRNGYEFSQLLSEVESEKNFSQRTINFEILWQLNQQILHFAASKRKHQFKFAN